jgi:hypothetical protein
MNWNSVVIIICILVAAFAVWKEYTRSNKSRLGLRIIALIAVVIALACIALPLSYHTDITKQDKNEAVLITSGFNKDSLNHYAAKKLFTLDRKIKNIVPKAVALHNLDELAADSTITQLRILGDGLDQENLRELNHLPVIFYPQAPKNGITAISWNEKINTGDELTIQGRFKNSSTKKVKLLLKGLSTVLDSVVIGSASTTDFQLATTPKSSGKIVYSLVAMVESDTLEKESLPVQIDPVKPLKVLMLTASPDFEGRFLKNWLSANGYAVAIRSAISKEKYSKEFINLEQFPLDHLTAPVLGKFDVLIGDLVVLKSLRGAEAAALQQEVTQKGLGIIVRADSTLRSTSWLQRDFSSNSIAVKEPAPVSLLLQGKTGRTAKLNAGLAYIDSQNGTQPLVSDERGHLLAGSTLAGAGKIIFTHLNNTFSWMLSGNKQDYSNLWSLLISKASRKVQVAENWNVLSAVPSVSNPVQLQLESAAAPSAIKANDIIIPPQQNSLIPFEWKVGYLPQSTGWQMVKQNNGILNWWYVYKDDEWSGIRTQKKQTDTKAYIAKNVIVNNVTKQIHEKRTIAVPKIYFYVLLLMACVFLWVEAKFL